MEAKALAKHFKREGLDLIYNSPMGRAIHTMQYTAEALNMDSHTLEWTRELQDMKIEVDGFGPAVAWNLHGEIIRNVLPDITNDNWHNLEYVKQNPNIYEKYRMIVNESDSFLKMLGYEREGYKYRIVKTNRLKIAVFCHAGFGMAWLSHLLEIPLPLVWSGFWLAPSSVTTVLFDERSDKWAVPRCLGVGEVSHLYEAALPVQPRGILENFY